MVPIHISAMKMLLHIGGWMIIASHLRKSILLTIHLIQSPDLLKGRLTGDQEHLVEIQCGFT
jgi:hypothetical protein